LGKNWYKEKKGEAWYKKAKREGYRARSAYKLQQIQERFSVLRAGDTVIDLGASPGGWSQVAAELVGEKGRVVAVDLSHMHGLEGVKFVRGDITLPETMDEVLRVLAADPRGVRVNVVISDMSPDITGNYTMDQANSVFLCQHALKFARRVLDVGGRFVVKIFEGEDFPEFRDELRKQFRDVKAYNPPASRKQSSEIYLVALSFKGAEREATPGSSGAARPS
jgi:23S rRNA (uridine2552-2'-O)-methyltransferase